MNAQTQEPRSRDRFAIRLLYTLLFPPIYGICNFLVLLTTLFQFALLLITLRHSEPVRSFANRVISMNTGYGAMSLSTAASGPFPSPSFRRQWNLRRQKSDFIRTEA